MPKSGQGVENMSSEFASSDLTAGQLNAIVKKLGGHDAAMRFLRGELTVSERTNLYRDTFGAIRFSVTSYGTTGEEWIRRLESMRYSVTEGSKRLLRSERFKPTCGKTTEIAVIKGRPFHDEERRVAKIHSEAYARKYSQPNAEIACLIREKFSDEDIASMGLTWIVVMHDPINKFSGEEHYLLGVSRYGEGRTLSEHHGNSDSWFCHEAGFAFVESTRAAS